MHFKGRHVPKIDLLSTILFWSWYIYVVYHVPNWSMRVLYIFITHAVAGVLHVQITISHFSMPINEQADDPTKPYEFIKTQFEHSLDVDCPEWMDWFHGGLQFQVVHHLFPRVPRHNLRHVRDQYVIPFCKKYNFNYQTLPFIEANKKVLGILQQTALKARTVSSDQLAPLFVYKLNNNSPSKTSTT